MPIYMMIQRICCGQQASYWGISDCLKNLRPKALIILGDRFEMLQAAFAASLLRITLVHIHGGELTHGAIDNKIRFAISHLSQLP